MDKKLYTFIRLEFSRRTFSLPASAAKTAGLGRRLPYDEKEYQQTYQQTPADETHQIRSCKIILTHSLTHSLGFALFVALVSSGGLTFLLLLEKEVDCPLVGQNCEEGCEDGR